jgi:hypothetical protein
MDAKSINWRKSATAIRRRQQKLIASAGADSECIGWVEESFPEQWKAARAKPRQAGEVQQIGAGEVRRFESQAEAMAWVEAIAKSTGEN